VEAAKGAREEALMLTRRDILKQAGTMVGLATTAPWWLVRRAHAARREKLIVWSSVALAPQVDKLLKDQCYAYAKQAGIKENELEYVELGTGQQTPKLVAALEAGNPPDIVRVGSALAALYRAQGHLLEVTDVVEKMQQVPGGLFPITTIIGNAPGAACLLARVCCFQITEILLYIGKTTIEANILFRLFPH
jgi:ABC-type glycerol-3-phosphate transport system substrate-binding protein